MIRGRAAAHATVSESGQKPARQQGLGLDAAQQGLVLDAGPDSLDPEPDRALPYGRASATEAGPMKSGSTRAVLTRPGASSRTGEVDGIAEALSRLFSNQQLHSIQEPGTLDGGDICEAEFETENGPSSHFFIGISERTNESGAEQLAQLVASYVCTSNFIDIRGLKNILHLKSGLAYLNENRLVVVDALANHAAFRGFELVRVNAEEEYAANCVRVNDFVLIAAGYPRFEKALEQLGYKTIALEMSEFQKLDGGLSCLSLRF
jgi:dimethylargininase